MTAIWIAAILVAWLLLAAIVGITVGRIARNRDRQVPR